MSGAPPIWFVTGVGTGVGKTVLTSLLLAALLDRGVKARAMKPFCSGGLGDVNLLFALQGASVSKEAINPFFFAEPLAPLAASRRQNRPLRLRDIPPKIESFAAGSDILLVEGAGGLLTPLGEGFSALDLILELRCSPLVVAANRLGVLNQTLLVHSVLESAKARSATYALMGTPKPGLSADSNAPILREHLGKQKLVEIPFLGPRVKTRKRVLEIAACRPPWLERLADAVSAPGAA